MKKEDFKVGMQIEWNDKIFEVFDVKYIDHFVVLKHLGMDYMVTPSTCCYEDMQALKNKPNITNGCFYVYQRKKNPKQVVARLVTETGDVFIGVAKCNPEDEFVFDVGATLAIKRALNAKEDYEKFLSTPAQTIADILLKSNLKGNKK